MIALSVGVATAYDNALCMFESIRLRLLTRHSEQVLDDFLCALLPLDAFLCQFCGNTRRRGLILGQWLYA